MKKVITFFIIAELLDCLTTWIGLTFGHEEMNFILKLVGNNWFYMLSIKFLVVAFIIWYMKKVYTEKDKLIWIFPIFAMFSVIYNLNCIIFPIVK